MKTAFETKELFEKISNDNTHYTLVILVIASRGESYDLFVECWKEYMYMFPEVKVYFVYSDNNITSNLMICENSIIHKGEEKNIPGIFKKTVAAMSFCEKHLSYDYILRTNLSSFFHIPRLLHYLSDKPKEMFIASHFNQIPSSPNQVDKQTQVNTYFKKIVNERFIYLHGSGFILSKDVIGKLLKEIKENPTTIKIPLSLPDDVGISMILYSFLTFAEDIDSAEYYHPKEFVNLFENKYSCEKVENPAGYKNPHLFHIRNKIDFESNDDSIEKRYSDIINYIHQIRHFYNKPTFMDYVDEVPSKKIVDCFTFYNELDMLEYRLSVLDETVDYFVLVEATKTHMGKDKPLFYSENKERFSKFNHKIIHIIVDDLIIPDVNNGEQWNNEKHQRNNIQKGLDTIELSDFDYIVISDLDEIPDPKVLADLKTSNNKINYASLKQDFYYYNLNSIFNEVWTRAKIISYKEYQSQQKLPSEIRLANAPQLIENGGWHLSYFGDASYIKNKLTEFSHQEFNTEEITNEVNIQNKIDNFEDILGREGGSITKVPISENKYLPPQYDVLLEKFIVLE